MTQRRCVPEGRAQVGDCFRDPYGRVFELVSVQSAGLAIEATVAAQIADYKGTPIFTRDSIAGSCAMYGQTTGREKRNLERMKAKQQKPIRKIEAA